MRKRKSGAKVLKEADPGLNVIPGGVRRRRPRKKAVKLNEVSYIELPGYIPRRMTEDDWNKAGGLKCPRCGNDAVKLVPIGLTGKVKMCPICIERRRRLLEHKRRLTDIRYGNFRPTVGSGKTTI